MMTGGSGNSGGNELHFRLRTRNRWISGHLHTVQRRLVDYLAALERTDLIQAEEVETSDALGERVVAASAIIQPLAVLFVLPVERVTPRREPAFWLQKRAERVVLGVGSYRIVGNIHLPPQVQISNLFQSPHVRFLVVAPALITDQGDPGFREEHAVALVNREHLEFVAPEAAGGAGRTARAGATLAPGLGRRALPR